jgi:CDP-glucose 4,6-dehydratase
LVTGHAGFKGSWLAAWLAELGANVVGLSLGSGTGQSGPRPRAPVTTLAGDVCDPRVVDAAFTAHRPEVVFHLAAQPLVRRSYAEPRETFAVNVMGTVNVVDAALRQEATRSVVVVTTDKVYVNREWLWGYRESDELGGHDPYGASKAGAELALRAYQNSAMQAVHRQPPLPRLGIASARAGNVIGGGDWAEDRLVPDVIRALVHGSDVVLRNPRSVRPWQHVLEPLSGYLWLAVQVARDPDRHSRAYNFGPSEEPVTAGEVASRLKALWSDSCSTIVVEEDDSGREARQLRLDPGLARAELDWRGVWGVDRALAETVAWYRGAVGAADDEITPLTAGQVRRYTKEASALGLAWAGEPAAPEPDPEAEGLS